MMKIKFTPTLTAVVLFLSLCFGLATVGGQHTTSAPAPTQCYDAWTASGTATHRAFHTAVWTGSEMIVWGGSGDTSYLNTGERYNPVTDTWTAISTTNAPAGREAHVAVWTGTEMIVWGGENQDGSLRTFPNDGGRYNPV